MLKCVTSLKVYSAKPQAMQGKYMPLAVVYHTDYDSAKRAFILFHQLSAARALVFVIFMVLPFFEVCKQIQTVL